MQQNIFSIKCSQCGSPLRFNILTQNYHCSACGCDMPAAEVTERVRAASKTFDSDQKLKLSASRNAHSVYSCRSCGNSMVIPDNEMIANCDFCGTSITKSRIEYSQFPQGIIPFYITRDEAVRIATSWARKNWSSDDIRYKLPQISKNLVGYYMPFQMITGPLRLNVFVKKKKYVCGGYLDGIFVSQTLNTPNLLLDKAEPFDTSDLVPFDFSYMAGQRALLPDAGTDKINKFMEEEMGSLYHPYIKKTFLTSSFHVRMPESTPDSPFDSQLIRNTVYLPMYVMHLGKNFWCVVNGQTGRVSSGNSKVQQKSSHGFLKREYSGQLRREFREFPQYRPQHPLFYKMLPDFKGEMHEKVGVYKMNILNKSLKAAKFAAFIAMHIYLFYIITLMSGDSSTHDFFSGVITVVSWCCGLFVLFFLLMLPEWLADPDFETVVPKYGNGGYQGDDETYYSEKRRRREVVTYSIVVVVFIVVVALLVSWIMKC